MKKFISSCLSVAMITTMFAVNVMPVAADNDNKATVNVYDFVGGVYDRNASVQSQLDGTAVSRGTYEFEVGDLVNVTTTYSSDTISAISGYVGHTFINQVSNDPKSESAFLQNTNSLNSTLQLDDRYFGDGIFCENKVSNTMFMLYPEFVYTDQSNPDYVEEDLKLDRVSYNGVNGSQNGIKLNNGRDIVTFTVLVTDNTECDLYTALQEVVDNSETVENVTTEIETTTSLEKVGHIDIEIPTEPETEVPTEPETEEPTAEPTVAPTEIETEEPTTAPTEIETEEPTEVTTNIYTVAGTPNLCNTNWDPTDVNNNMQKIDDNKYQITYTGVSVGDVQFKIVQNNSWDVSYGVPGQPSYDNNYQFTVENDNATVVITFDLETEEASWSITYPEEPTEEPTTAPTEVATEEPTTVPTEVATEEPTTAPTEIETEEPTTAPTEVATEEPTTAPTEVESQVATQNSTMGATTSTNGTNTTATTATTNNNNNTSNNTTATNTATGKVATGDSTAITLLLIALVIAGGAVVSTRKRFSIK